jgi:iron complex outermembrane receptor protein
LSGALLYAWNDRCKAYLNVSGSFQPPSFDQSLETSNDGNQLFHRLDAQTAIAVEAGTAGEAGPFSWDVAVYYSWVRNELLDLTNGQGFPLGTVNPATDDRFTAVFHGFGNLRC